eukprot:4818231-Lingulodinium_polyedra.AAC.1
MEATSGGTGSGQLRSRLHGLRGVATALDSQLSGMEVIRQQRSGDNESNLSAVADLEVPDTEGEGSDIPGDLNSEGEDSHA